MSAGYGQPGISMSFGQMTTGQFHDSTIPDVANFQGKGSWLDVHGDVASYSTISKETDRSIKVLCSTQNKKVSFLYPHHVTPLVPANFGEGAMKFELDAVLADGIMGIATGITKASSEYKAKAMVIFSTWTGKISVKVALDSNGIPIGNHTDNDDILLESSPIANYAKLVKNTYTLYIVGSRGTDPGIRVGFMVNGRMSWQSELVVDEYLNFDEYGAHPILGLEYEEAGNRWMNLYNVGLART